MSGASGARSAAGRSTNLKSAFVKQRTTRMISSTISTSQQEITAQKTSCRSKASVPYFPMNQNDKSGSRRQCRLLDFLKLLTGRTGKDSSSTAGATTESSSGLPASTTHRLRGHDEDSRAGPSRSPNSFFHPEGPRPEDWVLGRRAEQRQQNPRHSGVRLVPGNSRMLSSLMVVSPKFMINS